MTVGVYGLVAGIVKLDDAGLQPEPARARAACARQARARPRLLCFAPWLMKMLSVAGTAAMFLVGGGIVAHSMPALHHSIEASPPGVGGTVVSLLADLVVG